MTAAASDTYGFLTPAPRLYHLPVRSGRLAVTLDDLVWVEPGRNVTLTRGFPTDGVSLPGIALALRFDPWGRALRSALLHDAGYSLHDTPDLSLGTKREVDLRFRRGLAVDDPEWAEVYYQCVRWFGGWSWNKANAPFMDGYLYALRHGRADEWIAHLMREYEQPVIDLEPAL